MVRERGSVLPSTGQAARRIPIEVQDVERWACDPSGKAESLARPCTNVVFPTPRSPCSARVASRGRAAAVARRRSGFPRGGSVTPARRISRIVIQLLERNLQGRRRRLFRFRRPPESNTGVHSRDRSQIRRIAAFSGGTKRPMQLRRVGEPLVPGRSNAARRPGGHREDES